MFDSLKGKSYGDPEPKPSTPAPSPTGFSAPPKPAPAPQKSSYGNYLSHDVSIKGKVKLSGDIIVDGLIEGEITTPGTVTLDVNAVINATINAGTVIVHGKVNGNINATESIELHQSANVTGDLASAVLTVIAGATLVGSSSIGKPAPKQSPKPAPAPEKKDQVKPGEPKQIEAKL